MRNVTRLPESDRRELFRNTADKMGLNDAIVEKDFWVCFTLDYLFHRCPWKDAITFKGGTSLSKAFNLISRFSEDIDLILDWWVLGYGKDEPWEKRSNTKQDAPTIDIQRRDVLCRALEQRSKLLLQEVQSRSLQCVVPSESLSASSSIGVYDIPLLQKLITPVAQQYQLPAVYLFGSYARGTANGNSDIDLLIEARGSKIRSLLDLGALHQGLTRILGKEVDLITVRSLEQSSTVPSDATFRDQVLNERVCLYAVS